MTTLLTKTKEVDSYDIYKQQKEREQIRSKARHIEATAGLITSLLDAMEQTISEELERARKEAKENNTYISDFHSTIENWEDDFKNLRLALQGIQNESEEIDTKLCYIMHFVHNKTGIQLNYITKED